MLDICVSYKCSPSRSSRAMNAHAPHVVPVNTRARKKFKRVGVMEGLASHLLPAARLYNICTSSSSSNQIVEIKEKHKSKEKENGVQDIEDGKE